jgi:hypothetical protein
MQRIRSGINGGTLKCVVCACGLSLPVSVARHACLPPVLAVLLRLQESWIDSVKKLASFDTVGPAKTCGRWKGSVFAARVTARLLFTGGAILGYL